MTADVMKTQLLRMHARNPAKLAMGAAEPSFRGEKLARVGDAVLLDSIDRDGTPGRDDLSEIPGVVRRPDDQAVIHFRGTKDNGVATTHNSSGDMVSQDVVTPESVKSLHIRDTKGGFRVLLQDIDRVEPEKTTEESYVVAPNAAGEWQVSIPVGYLEELPVERASKLSQTGLGPDANLKREDGVWLLVGQSPF